MLSAQLAAPGWRAICIKAVWSGFGIVQGEVMAMGSIKWLLMLFVLVFTACGGSNSSDSQATALVSSQQFARAQTITNSLAELIRFRSPMICFARALFHAAALGAEEIPSSALYAYPRSGEFLQGTNGAQWNYHVAVAIRASDSSELMVLDPALSERPLVDWRWKETLAPDDQLGRDLLLPGSVYARESADRPWRDGAPMVTSFAGMPRFKQADIENACGEISRFEMPNNARLHAETIRIVERLQELDKIDIGVLTPGFVYCGRTRISP
jgi:Glutaminase